MVFSLFFRFGKICFSTCRWCLSLSTAALGARAMWVLWSIDAGLEVVDLSLFPEFIDGI
jgi:hypothetical protein